MRIFTFTSLIYVILCCSSTKFNLAIAQEKYFQRLYEVGQERGVSFLKVSTNGKDIYGIQYTEGRVDRDVGFIKLDSNLTPIWSKLFDSSVYEDTQAGFLVTEGDTIYGTFSTDASNSNWLVKMTGEGGLIWSKKTSTSFEWIGRFRTLEFGDNQFAMVGSATSSFLAAQPVIIEFDENGNVQRSLTITGGVENVFWSAESTNDGGIIIVGNEKTDSLASDHSLIKLNKNLEIEWARVYGGPGPEHDAGKGSGGRGSVIPFEDGYFYTGLTRSFGYGGEDVVLARLNLLGEVVWAKVIGTEQMDYTAPEQLEVVDNLVFLVMSSKDEDDDLQTRLMRFEFDGTVKSQLEFGPNENRFLTYFKPYQDGWIFGSRAQITDSTQDAIMLLTDINGGGVCNSQIGDFFYVHELTDSLKVDTLIKKVEVASVDLVDFPLKLRDRFFALGSVICPDLRIKSAPAEACPGSKIKLTSRFDFGVRWTLDAQGLNVVSEDWIYEPTFQEEVTFHLFDWTGRTYQKTISLDPTSECLNIIPNSTLTICAGDTIHLSADQNKELTWFEASNPDSIISTDSITGWVVGSHDELVVKNKWGVDDTLQIEIVKSGCFKISFLGDSVLCPGDELSVEADRMYDYEWFELGEAHKVGSGNNVNWEIDQSVGLIALNQWGASDTLFITLRDSLSCLDVEIFQLISPNGDGDNEGFVINGLEKFKSNLVVVFNTWGQEVFRQKDYENGSWTASDLPDGDYLYHVTLGNTPPEIGQLSIKR